MADEVGNILFEEEATNLFFQPVSSRCERASIIPTSNLPFGRRDYVFGDPTVASAMIDRIIHPAGAAQEREHPVALFSNGTIDPISG